MPGKKQSVVTPLLVALGLLLGAAGGTIHAATFAEWIATTSLTGADALPTADPDGDGHTNLYEFAMDGMDPEEHDRPDLTLMWQVQTATDTYDAPTESIPDFSGSDTFHLVLKYKLRADTEGVRVTPQQSRSLELDTWAWGDSASHLWTDSGYTYARFHSDTSKWPRGFLRLWIEEE
jgi:hypothetical protein